MYSRKSLSVVIITLNEAELLPDCLTSVNWVDEIIVLDGGSYDETCHIAIQAGALVFQSAKWHGFGRQRQIAQSYASGDYILMLDADERVTLPLRQAIEEVLQHPVPNAVYSCSRRNLFLGRFMHHNSWYSNQVIRLYARKSYCYNVLTIHESLEINGAKIIQLRGYMKHLTCFNLTTFQHKQIKYAEAWALERYRQGQKCYFISIFSHTYSAFLKTWLLQAGFMDGKYGWLLAVVNSQYTFNKYTALWAFNYSTKRHDV